MKFPEIPKAETLERRYIGKLSKKGLMFIKSLLKMEPSERLTTSEALKHVFFEGLYSEEQIGSIYYFNRKRTKNKSRK